MTVDPAYDAAVEIALTGLDERDVPWLQSDVEAVVTALARAGWLHDPRRAAALEAVAEAARAALDVDPTSRAGTEVHIRLEAALDATPTAEPTSGERDLQFHCTHSTHEVAPLRCGGRHYGLPCGPGCAPVVP